MRIAVLFYGRIKHYEKKYMFSALPNTAHIDFFYSADGEPQHLIDDFCALYKPKAVINEKIVYDLDLNKYPHPHTNVHNMTCHFINLKRVFKLLENYISNNNEKYDVIISIRHDLCIENQLELLTPLKNTVYIPSECDYNGINDRFAFGDIEAMKKYMNIYDNCEHLLENNYCFACPEMLTLANIKYCKLDVQRFDVKYNIYR